MQQSSMYKLQVLVNTLRSVFPYTMYTLAPPQKTETKKDTTEDIEETKQNLSKLVQETYVKEDGDAGDGSIKQKDGKEKSNKVQCECVLKATSSFDKAYITLGWICLSSVPVLTA